MTNKASVFCVFICASLWLKFPDCGVPRYGNRVKNGTSLFGTPSPSVLFGDTLVAGVNGVPPATARNAISTTSSNTLRPFGKPATSPPSSPSRLGLTAGGIATLSRSISCGRPSERKVVKFGPVTLLTGMPVANIATRSFRGAWWNCNAEHRTQ